MPQDNPDTPGPNTNKPTRGPKRPAKETALRVTAAVVAAALVLGAAMLAALPFVAMPLLGLTRHVSFSRTFSPEEASLAAEPVTLETEDGLNIQAWFAPSQREETKAAIIFLSGILRPSVTWYFPHAAWLAGEGYASMPVETRAHGASDGDRMGLGITEIADVAAAVDYLRDRLPGAPVVVFGVSMGGVVAVNSFGEIPEIAAPISLSAYTSWPDEFTQMMNSYYHIPRFIAAAEQPFVWLYLGFTFGFDKLGINPLNEIKKANGRPILLMQSTQDSQVAFENYEALSEAAPDAESFLRDGDTHMIISDEQFLTPWEDTAYAEAILDFLDRNFGGTKAAE
ncbi:MAG: alpha/beta hydrolase [Oscillospiraceae bacterium]|jgi:alpha-beta hydrolase superfamily lysophospholipase|nr:alpha/beta hydrolase [Oscillospiraceae bacterium]